MCPAWTRRNSRQKMRVRAVHTDHADSFDAAIAVRWPGWTVRPTQGNNSGRQHQPKQMSLDHGATSLSIVIPAYSEEAYIEKCVTSLERVLEKLSDDYEIIVVDDGSRDATAGILERLQRTRPYLVVVHHDRNYGLGRTLRSGFDRCRKEHIFYSDADLPFDFAQLERA